MIRDVSRLYGRFRGRRLLIVSCGPSFADLDLEPYRDWDIWCVNAAIVEVPDWARRPSTMWVAGHLDTFLHRPHYSPFRERLDAVHPDGWRVISYTVYYDQDEEIRERSARFFGFRGKDFPGPQGCTFCRALLIANRCCFEKVVIAGADFKREPGEPTIYAPPFDWRPASPDRMADHRRIIHEFAARGLIDGTFSLHPTTRWEDPPFPIEKE